MNNTDLIQKTFEGMGFKVSFQKRVINDYVDVKLWWGLSEDANIEDAIDFGSAFCEAVYNDKVKMIPEFISKSPLFKMDDWRAQNDEFPMVFYSPDLFGRMIIDTII